MTTEALRNLTDEESRLYGELLHLKQKTRATAVLNEKRVFRVRMNEIHDRFRQIHVERCALNGGYTGPQTPESMVDRRLGIANLEKQRLQQQIRDLTEQVARLESRLSAGAERRRGALLCLNGLLACEDEDMPEEEWERRMDRVVRDARTILSLEKTAVASAA